MAIIWQLRLWVIVSLLILLVTSATVVNSDEQVCVQDGRSSDWDLYKRRFVSDQGRVIDTGNGGISHSEGQGFGMRLAFHYGARQDFDRIWTWTQEHLYVRDDHLAAWRWRPDSDPHIDDKNNAADGDLFIAWSLAMAGRCWSDKDYTESARRITEDIRKKLVRKTSAGYFLVPGAAGFVHGDQLTLNPSYWVFPAFTEFSKLEPDAPEWAALIADGYALFEQFEFGRWDLVPDWISWLPKSGFTLSDQFAPRFGYEAIRVPLYMIWHGRNSEVLNRLSLYWAGQRNWTWRPDWVDLKTDAISSYAAPAGIGAIADLTRFAVASAGGHETSTFLSLPRLDADQSDEIDYYSASLSLLARIAADSWCRQFGCSVDGR